MRVPSPSPSPLAADSPRVGEEQGSTWRPAPLLRLAEAAPGPEAYALFRPAEVLAGERSARLRRLESEMVDLRLEDIYGALTMPWQLDRRDVNEARTVGGIDMEAHGSEWDPSLAPDFWVSTDTGKVCVAPMPGDGHADPEPGQYHREVGRDGWQRFGTRAEAPGNAGGFHCCCVETAQPGTGWTLVAKLADFGPVLGRDAGLRAEFAALVRDDCEAIVASVGEHDECRSLFLVDRVLLPSGRVLLADPAELEGLGAGPEGTGADGPAVPSGLGAGYYPVLVSRDASQRVCRITMVFHPARAARVWAHFPPHAAQEAAPEGNDIA